MEQNNFNFSYSSILKKSGEASNGRIPIVIIPNHPTPDRVNDLILAEAFEHAKEEFLTDGVIDYDHLSVIGKNPFEQAQAIIGQPTDLFVNKDGVPECHAFLFEENPYVKECIMPALKTGSTVWGASVGGKALKSEPINSDKFSKTKQSNGKKISRILLKHIAITPLQRAVHGGTSVSLKKSFDGETEVHFQDYSELVKSFSNDEYLKKALVAGVETDIANISGGQALQTQSLEGSSVNQIFSLEESESKLNQVFHDILIGLISDQFKSQNEVLEYINFSGLNETEKKVILETLAKHKERIVSMNKSFSRI